MTVFAARWACDPVYQCVIDVCVGDRFGSRLVVEVGLQIRTSPAVRVACDCGRDISVVALYTLRSGVAWMCQSCGNRGKGGGRPPTRFVNVGERYGDLTVLDTSPHLREAVGGRSRPGALCRCDCTAEVVVGNAVLLSGKRTSCGCGRVRRWTKHGLSKHPSYPSWASMMDRCHNPKSHNFGPWGGRGIYVLPEWRHGPEAFLSWADRTIGVRLKGMSLDRIDNDWHYVPTQPDGSPQLRWATSSEQMANRRTLMHVTPGEYAVLAAMRASAN